MRALAAPALPEQADFVLQKGLLRGGGVPGFNYVTIVVFICQVIPSKNERWTACRPMITLFCGRCRDLPLLLQMPSAADSGSQHGLGFFPMGNSLNSL